MTTTTEPTTLTDEQRDYIDGIHAMADWFEAHPEYMPLSSLHCGFHLYDESPEGLAAAARTLGTCEKDSDDKYFHLVKRFGPHEYYVQAMRDNVCERVVVGTETVDVEEPDPEAVAALPTVKRTETREVVEWRCPDSILRATS